MQTAIDDYRKSPILIQSERQIMLVGHKHFIR